VPRVLRCTAPETTQHVILRGNNRGECFRSAPDHLLFRDCVATAIHRYPCDIHAYVLMPNHVHFLMTARSAGAIGKAMQSIGRRYVRGFNERHGRTGTLWEGRYRAKLIGDPPYLFTASRYIELNPVRAGLVNDPGDYAWSSYSANALGCRDELVTPHALYDSLGRDASQRLAAYRALFTIAIDDVARHAIRPRLVQARPYSNVG